MATETYSSLRLKFQDANEEAVTFTYKYCKPANTISGSDVKALMQGMITNNTIWQKTPVTINSATVITRSTTDIDIS